MMEIWQVGFSDHHIRDAEDYSNHVGYICRNPVGRKLVERASEFPYCSAFPGTRKDDVPQWLKPLAHRLSARLKPRPFKPRSNSMNREFSKACECGQFINGCFEGAFL